MTSSFLSGVSQAGNGKQMTFETYCERCGLTFTVPIDRFKDEEYINWLKASLCLQITKEGLEDFIEITTKDFFDSIKSQIADACSCKSRCKLSKFQRDDFNCPSNTCNELRNKLHQQSNTGRLTWNNTTILDMVCSQHEVAKLFMPGICKSYKGPKEGDSTAVLILLDECRYFRSKLQDPGLVNEARDSRNAIMHSGTMRIYQHQFAQHIHNFINLLEDSKHLKQTPRCIEAIRQIRKISDDNIQINLLEVETNVMDRHNKLTHDEINDLKQTIESSQCSEKELADARNNAKTIEVKQSKLKVLMEIYNANTITVEKSITKASTLYKTAEKRLEDIKNKKMNDIDSQLISAQTTLNKQMRENEELRKRLDEETANRRRIKTDLERTEAENTTLQKKLDAVNIFKKDEGSLIDGNQNHDLLLDAGTIDYSAGDRDVSSPGIKSNFTSPVDDLHGEKELVLDGKEWGVKDMHETILTNKSTLQKLQLSNVDLSLLVDQLLDILNLKQLVSLEMSDVKISHEQVQMLYKYFLHTDQLREVRFNGLYCMKHDQGVACERLLSLTQHKNLNKIVLCRHLPFTSVAFHSEKLLEFVLNLPGNVPAQMSSLQNLHNARSLQMFSCWCLDDNAIVKELVEMLPQLDSLQRLNLNLINFGSVMEICLSTAVEKLKFVELWDCTIESEGIKSLVNSLPKHRIEVVLGNIIIRGSRTVLQEIRDSPNTDLTWDSDVTYEYGEWGVQLFEFYKI